jgi:hypothetical protein
MKWQGMLPPNPRENIPDYAKRAADIINSYFAYVQWWDLKDKWLAIRLSDGGSDGVLYENKRDAVRHQLDEYLCAYVCFRNLMGGITPLEAKRYMDYSRMLYDGGARLPDPDDINGGPTPFFSVSQHDELIGRKRRAQLN